MAAPFLQRDPFMGKKSKKRRAKERAARAKNEARMRSATRTEADAHSGTHEVARDAAPQQTTPPSATPAALTERYGGSPGGAEERHEESEPPHAPLVTRSDAQPVMAHEEHRASLRVSVAVDIHMASESHFFSGLSGDISEGGLFLSTYRPLSIGHEVDLEFSLPGEKEPVHARGEVRWLREHSAHEPRGVGIAFEALAEADRDKIHHFCSIRPPLYYDDVG